MKNTSEQIAMLKNLLDTGSISQQEYEDMLGIALQTDESTKIDGIELVQDNPKETLNQQNKIKIDSPDISNQSHENKKNTTITVLYVLTTLFLLGLILFVTLFFQNKAEVSRNTRDASKEQNRLQEEVSQKNQIIQNLEGQLEQLSEFQPIFGSNLKFHNDGIGESTNSNGIMCFRQDAVRYIYTNMNIHCLKPGRYTIEKRMYEPSGNLSRTDGYSPTNATSAKLVELSKGFNDVDLSGWGSANESTYGKGTYPVEIWCQGKLLAKSYFIVK
jgi:hypothetical protein